MTYRNRDIEVDIIPSQDIILPSCTCDDCLIRRNLMPHRGSPDVYDKVPREISVDNTKAMGIGELYYILGYLQGRVLGDPTESDKLGIVADRLERAIGILERVK